MRTSTCLLPKVIVLTTLVCALCSGLGVTSQALGDAIVPASYESGGFFNQQLGTALRFNYHTRGYGTQDDVFSLGGMKVVPLDGATVFFDGQGTLSDDFGGGFNLGVGYRQLTTTGMNFDPQRILGLGFWTDGQSTASDNFFTQLGFSLESLGDSFDLRLNGHFPLERTQTSDAVLTGTGTPFFEGFNIFGANERVTVDTAHNVVDGEFAKRIMDLEAWGFIGGYQLGGGGVDATGYRVGVRGYAVPDLAVSLQVTDDDQYATNVLFGLTWFIGRTHKGNAPGGTILDRFREPVIRNDFIAMTSRQISRPVGDALTYEGTTNAIRVVHVNSSAAAGGDGSFENPFNLASQVDAGTNPGNTEEGDIIFVHSGSALTGPIGLQTDQSLFGEGLDLDGIAVQHFVLTNEMGQIALPESSAGASSGVRPTIDGTGLANVITLADGSKVDNFTINGGQTGVLANMTAAPTGSMLANLEINDTTVAGISLQSTTGSVVIDNTVVINDATGTGLLINGGADNVSMAGTINDTTGMAVVVQGRTGGTVDLTGTIDDDTDDSGDFGQGILVDNNTDATVNFTGTLNLGSDTGSDAFVITNNTNTSVTAAGAVDITAANAGNGLVIAGNDDTSSIEFSDLNATGLASNTGSPVSIADDGEITISSVGTRGIQSDGIGTAVVVNGDSVLEVNSNITSTMGRSVDISGRTDNQAQFAGDISDSGLGILISGNTGGTNLFTGAVTTDTGSNTGVTVTNTNTDALTSFGGGLTITTTDGTGFLANGAGTLLVSSTTGAESTIETDTGTALDLRNTSIDAGNVTFASVNTNMVATGNAIFLQNLDGAGTVQVGNSSLAAGTGGTISSQSAAIRIDNAENVSINNMEIENGATTGAGVDITGSAGDSVELSGVNIETDGATAFSATGGGTLATSGVNLTTNTGQALVLNGQVIDATGATFATVNTTNATNTAVNLANLTGGTVTVGSGSTAGDGGTVAVNSGNNAVIVNNVDSAILDSLAIENNGAGGGLNITGQQAGSTVSVNTTSANTTTNTAVRAGGNSDGIITFNTLAAETTSGTALSVQNNGSAVVSANSVTLQTTTGTGLFNNGTGTLNVNGTNTITTTSGIGVSIDNSNSGTFNNVTVTTTGSDAVNILHTSTSSSDISFNNLTVAGAGNRGMDVLANGSAEFDLSVSNSTINAVGDEGIFFDTGASAGRVDFTLTNSTITVGDQNALLATLDDSNTADVRIVIDNNTMSNASGTADSDLATLDISVGSGLDASVRVGSLFAGQDPPDGTIGDNNVFTNSSVDGDPVRISINDGGAGGVLNLDLRDNTAQSGSVQFSLTQTSGTFNLVDSVDTLDPNNANNVGDVIGSGTINQIAPPILAPTP